MMTSSQTLSVIYKKEVMSSIVLLGDQKETMYELTETSVSVE